MKAWEIQDDESSKAYHAFCHYRDLPPSGRSIDAAYAEHLDHCQDKATNSPETVTKPSPRKRAIPSWKHWSVDHTWPSRASWHDSDLALRRRERRAGEVEKAEDELVTLSRSLISRLATRIAGLNVEEIPVDSIPRWLKVVGDLELKALGRGDL